MVKDILDILIEEIREAKIGHRPIVGYKSKEHALRAAKKRQEGGIQSKGHLNVGPMNIGEYIGCSGWVYVSKNFGWLIPGGYCYQEDIKEREKRK